MKAWLITNKYHVSESFNNLKNLFFISAKKHDIDLIEYNNINVREIIIRGNYQKPSFVLFWDKDVKLASLLECDGLKVFNSSESIRLCDDKALTYIKLKDKGIRQPKTIISPLLYYHNASEDNDFIDFVIKELGTPFVFKECFGSFGQQVSLINNREEFINKIKKVDTWPYIMQEYIKSSFGRDLRIYVVGNEVAATMLRVNESGDFRANIESGSKGHAYDANELQIEMALKVVKELGLDFGGIDLLFGENDEPIFCEANSNAYFNELNKVTNSKLEDKILDFIALKC